MSSNIINDGGDEMEAARIDMDAARHDVLESEKEIQEIKNLLRQVTTSTDQGNRNTLAISAIKVSGYYQSENCSETDIPVLKLQLSSPIEELVLTKLFDPLASSDNQKETTESRVVFYDVDTSIATLTVTAFDNAVAAETPNLLGTSVSHDIGTMCEFDVLTFLRNEMKLSSFSELDVVIISVSDLPPTAISLVEKAQENEEDEYSGTQVIDVSEFSDAKEDESSVALEGALQGKGKVEFLDDENKPVTPEESLVKKDVDAGVESESEQKLHSGTDLPTTFCTVKLSVEYTPSKKDQQEKLYELLNQSSKRKAQAIERLRKSAAAVSRGKSQSTTKFEGDGEEDPSAGSSRAVQPGFLNKKKRPRGQTSASNFFTNVYKRILGPQSLIAQAFPIAKNYFLFFGVVAFVHWKGDMLALPAPL